MYALVCKIQVDLFSASAKISCEESPHVSSYLSIGCIVLNACFKKLLEQHDTMLIHKFPIVLSLDYNP